MLRLPDSDRGAAGSPRRGSAVRWDSGSCSRENRVLHADDLRVHVGAPDDVGDEGEPRTDAPVEPARVGDLARLVNPVGGMDRPLVARVDVRRERARSGTSRSRKRGAAWRRSRGDCPGRRSAAGCPLRARRRTWSRGQPVLRAQDDVADAGRAAGSRELSVSPPFVESVDPGRDAPVREPVDRRIRARSIETFTIGIAVEMSSRSVTP